MTKDKQKKKEKEKDEKKTQAYPPDYRGGCGVF